MWNKTTSLVVVVFVQFDIFKRFNVLLQNYGKLQEIIFKISFRNFFSTFKFENECAILAEFMNEARQLRVQKLQSFDEMCWPRKDLLPYFFIDKVNINKAKHFHTKLNNIHSFHQCIWNYKNKCRIKNNETF